MLTEATIREAFASEVPVFRTTGAYRLGLLVVTLATVLLPVIYFALIVFAGIGVFWYAEHAAGLVSKGGGLFSVILYATPIVAGALIVLFMLKPLLARPAVREGHVELRPAQAPLLFAFVECIRKAVRAPAPASVVVDCNVNASASFRGGLVSLLRRDLVLTIGLPLAVGLSLRQLAGVLAHEFGHFSQGSGMRLSYLVRSINGWFARVVYERDSWDAVLRQVAKLDFRLAIIVYMSRFMVWLTRRLLWLLMMLGHGISTYMLRQMEFDADRYEAHLAGSSTFKSTALRIRVLSVAANNALAGLAHSWAQKQLCEAYPELVINELDMIPNEVRKAIENETQTGSFFDTHPPDEARIASVEREGADGIFRLDGPATFLFRDWADLSRQATMTFYREVHGLEPSSENLVALDAYSKKRRQLVREAEGAGRYFMHAVGILRPLQLLEKLPGPVEDIEGAVQALKRTRAAIEEQAPDFVRVVTQETLDRRTTTQVTDSMFHLVQQRFISVLGLLDTDSATPQIENRAERLQFEHCYAVAVAFGELKSAITRLVNALNNAGGLMELASAGAEVDESKRTQALSSVLELMSPPADRLRGVYYPFEHASGPISITEFALPGSIESPGLSWEVVPYCGDFLGRLADVYHRCLGVLAATAEGVETSLGLSSIEIPREALSANDDAIRS